MNAPRVGTAHLDYRITSASWDQLVVTPEVAKSIAAAATKGNTVETGWEQRITGTEAAAIKRLASLPAGSTETVTLSGSGIKLTRDDCKAIMDMASGADASPRRELGSGGATITQTEVQGVVNEATRGEATIGKVMQAEVDAVAAWKTSQGANMTAGAKGVADAFVTKGANDSGKIDPNVGASRVVYPEYQKMFKDGVFDNLVVIGYDEDGSHVAQTASFLKAMSDRGYLPIDSLSPPLTADERTKLESLTPRVTVDEMRAANAAKPPVVQYYAHRIVDQQTGKSVIALQRVVLPIDQTVGSPAAIKQAQDKEAYIKQHMGHVDAFLYGGHARHGSGPDVDPIDSSAGNVRVATPYDSHVTTGAKDVIDFPAGQYQFMMFAGCTTNNYLRELNTGEVAKSRDLVTTNQLGTWGGIGGSLIAAIDGIEGQRSYNDLVPDLDKNHGIAGIFEARNIGDNQFVPFPTVTLRSRSEFAPVLAGTQATAPLARGVSEHGRLLQQFLNKAMPDLAPLAMDGDPGPNTIARIQEFKRRHSITPADATITREFLEALQSDVDTARAAARAA